MKSISPLSKSSSQRACLPKHLPSFRALLLVFWYTVRPLRPSLLIFRNVDHRLSPTVGCLRNAEFNSLRDHTVDSTIWPDCLMIDAFSGRCMKACIATMSSTSNIKWIFCGLAASTPTKTSLTLASYLDDL